MNTSQGYILLSIGVLIMVLLILFLTRKERQKPLSKLAGLAFLFIIAGIAFGESRTTGYSLMGVGVVLAIIDIIKKRMKPKIKNE
jgi:uncharacterized membrane protein